MPKNTDQDLLALTLPGTVIEIDRRTAEALGAFEETALSEEDALASVDIPAEHLPADDNTAETCP